MEVKNIEITPFQNGIHSLAEAIKSFYIFHENQKEIFSLKDAILRTHHALETLLKDVLYKVNPLFLIQGKKNIDEMVQYYKKFLDGQLSTPLDEISSINLEMTIERLKIIGLLSNINKNEIDYFINDIKELSRFRNKLQHLGLKIEIDIVERILGSIIPRAIDILEEIYKNLLDLRIKYPSVFGRLPIKIKDSDIDFRKIRKELYTLYPNSEKVIKIFRHKYDTLLKDAISFFRGQKFTNQELKLNIRYHGKVGAPPYLPEIVMEGFLNFSISPHYFIGLEYDPYIANINISKITLKKHNKKTKKGIAEGSLGLEAKINIDKAEHILKLPTSEEKISILRNFSITVRANISYEANVFKNNVHYICNNIIKADGELNIAIAALPIGFRDKESELIGYYKSKINQKNAPFRLSAFLAPDDSINEDGPLDLEWVIKTKEDIEFI